MVCKLCVVQISPRPAKKLAESLTVSELTDLCDTLPELFPSNAEDLTVELDRYYSDEK